MSYGHGIFPMSGSYRRIDKLAILQEAINDGHILFQSLRHPLGNNLLCLRGSMPAATRGIAFLQFKGDLVALLLHTRITKINRAAREL